ncbi:aldo/keto reductase [Microbacterium sp. No. 7]|uniref:aldo/keto reductase n=1 Tax=Microbacterium sp. No. 7 TaxID=1714373 RepID=UPI0006ECE89C|nr:aldo/keto reductase [Microbacterium sp. No. 7]ALJ21063.1 oxidoreductase [Microbacterium sp. No. 7]
MIGADAITPQPPVPGTRPLASHAPRTIALASGPVPLPDAPPRRPLGETGLQVFPLAIGAGEFGWHVAPLAASAILDVYRAHGGNFVHMSDGDASGRSEHIVGQWMRSRGVRDETVVAVRIGADNEHPGLGPVNLVRSVEASLSRLQTDRIDLLYLNATTDGATPLEDTLATAEWLVESGKVRAVGSFCHTAAQLVEARILSSAGYPRLAVLDVPFNVLHRTELDGDRRLVATAQSIAITPSRALAHGFLAGVHRGRAPIGRSVRGTQLAASMNRRGHRALRVLDRVARELSIPTAAAAIAWLLAEQLVAAPIVNAREAAHVEELVQGAGAHLTLQHRADITRAGQ